MILLRATVFVVAVSLAGCAMDPVHVEQDFGNSVRQMVTGQIRHPDVASNPSSMAAEQLDGVVAEESLEGYRQDSKRPDSGRREISFSID